MNQISLKTSTAINFIIIILFSLIGYTGNFFKELGDNLAGIRHNLGYSRGIVPTSLDCLPEELDYYPSLATCIQDAIHNSLDNGHILIDSWGYQLFPERRSLLLILKGMLYWKEENYNASCKMFKEAGNKLEMQTLAQVAFDQGNWVALESYLECIDNPTGEYWSASPSQISVMFHTLGKHFEQMELKQKALWAYRHAIDWYPTVWADPVLAAARILAENGQRDEAENLVLRNFNSAELPWSIFNLGKQLGIYLEEDGDMRGAYCAYLMAQRAGEDSPIHLVPDSLRRDVNTKLVYLASSYQLSPQDCPIND